MIAKILLASCLVAVTVTIHAAGLALVFRPAVRTSLVAKVSFWPTSWLLSRVAWWLIVVHLIEIAIWAFVYWNRDCMPDLVTSFYFSGVTYATLGYGDVVLPPEWRLFGPLEGLVGILMCGLSTGFFFAVMSTLFIDRLRREESGDESG